nr:MAG TPA: minor tail protein [Caudoviricetes sp.]
MSLSSNIRAGRAYVEVTAETSKLQRNLTSAQAQLQNFGRTCTNVGKDLLMLSGAMAAPLVMAARSFAGFDDSMRLVQAVTQATDADFKALTKTAQRLGRDTSYTAQQAADAMVSLGRMGFSPTEIQASIDAVLNLARSTGTELAEAGDIAANSMRIFGIEASQMSDVADVLTVTANSSAQTLIDLFEALKMGGPQAAAAGESIRETSAAIAVLANMGIKGSLAGTALRKSFSQFAKVKVQDQLRSVGVETVDANGNLRKMAEIMRDIAKAMSTMPTAEKLAFAEDIFDIRGSLAGLTLTANTDELDAMLAKLQDVEGVAANTAKKMDAGLGGAFRLLLSAVEGAMNAIADAMNSTLQPLVVKVTAVINAFTQWIEANQGLVTAFAVTVAGAAGLAVVLIAIGVAAKGAAAGIAVVQTAIKGFTFLQGVAIAQGTALKTSFTLLTQSFADYRNTAIPALVGTEKFCAALGLASTSANRARASIILMSNAEAAAAAKSALAAKWQAVTKTLASFRNTALAAAVATKAQAAAEAAAAVKTALVSGWTAMANALKGLTLSSIAAAAALKAQAVAEGAMAAGRALATAWTAMASTLKSYTAASIAATVAVKAQTVAEALCTAGSVALNQVRKAGIAVTALFTAANLKAVIAVSAVAAGNFLLAGAAKVAAAAMLALGGVMSFIAAHPVAIALIALGAVLAGVCIYLSRAGSYTAQLSDKMSTLREKGDQLRKTDEIRMERLQQLAAKQKLTNAEMAEARMLASKLQKKYGDLGITFSDNAMRITALSSAAAKLGELTFKVSNADDLEKMARLEELSVKVSLELGEQNEAAALIEELSAKYGALGLEVDRARGRIRALSEEAERLEGIRLSTKIDAGDLPKFDQLKALSMELDLTIPQQNDAERLIGELSKKYGDLGLVVNRTTGQIERLNTVAGAISDLSFKVRGSEDIEKLNRLKALSIQAKLDVQGREEAERLISELEAKYGSLGMTVDKVSGKIAAMNAESARIGAMELSVKDSGDLDKLRELKALSLEVTLDVDQQNDTERLIGELSKKYGDLGVAVDRTAGKIVKLNSVAASLREISIKVSGTEDANKVSRLQTLSQMPKLDASGIAEANTLLEQLRAKYGDLGLSVDTARGRIVALTETQRQFTAAAQIIQAGNDPQKETHLAQLERLRQLAEQEKLTAAEQQEAQTIVNALNGAYNDLGLGIDTITGKLNLAASAQDKFNEAMKAATLGELDAEIAELEANLKELQAEDEALLSYWNHNLWSQISGRQEEAQKKIEANGERASAYRQKIWALQKRRQAVQEGKPGATTGEEGKTATTEEKVEAEKQRRQAASDNADAAAKRVAEIDKQLARERKTELENEIDDIIALRDEYKQLIQTMLDYEKSRPEKEQDKAKIAELEGKLAGADQTAEDRIAKAREKAARKMKDDVASYQERFQESEQSIQDRREEAAQDRKIDETLRSDPAAGQQMLEGLIAQYQKEAAAAKAQFEKELQDAQADGKIDDDERKKLDDAHSAYSRAESMVDKYSDRLRSAQDGTREAAEKVSKPQGAFLAAALENLGESSAADRTAKATETIVANTKKTNTLLKKQNGMGTFA